MCGLSYPRRHLLRERDRGARMVVQCDVEAEAEADTTVVRWC